MIEPVSDDNRRIVDKPAPGADPDTPAKPASPPRLSTRTLTVSLKRAVGEFLRDQCPDLAASLTYYAVLSLFPALVALVSLLGVFGQGAATVDAVMEILRGVAPGGTLDTLQGPIDALVSTDRAGFALVAGLLGALWTASIYVGAFGRAMNRIYEVEEGRPIWKLRPATLVLTAALLVLAVIGGLTLALSGPVSRQIGDVVGLGDTAVAVWGVVKWPLLLAVVVLGLGLLYRYTPNVAQPRFRWLSVGAVLTLAVGALATVGFGFFVSNVGSFDATYGSLAGVVVFLLWLWLSNLAMLLGAEVDAELERGRQLQSGWEAEENILLPPRDVSASDKAQKRYEKTIDTAADLRRAAAARKVRDELPR